MTTLAALKFIAVEYSPSKQLVNDTIYSIPNKRGLGAFVFEPTLAGNVWSDPMFNTSGTAISSQMAIYDGIAATYGFGCPDEWQDADAMIENITQIPVCVKRMSRYLNRDNDSDSELTTEVGMR